MELIVYKIYDDDFIFSGFKNRLAISDGKIKIPAEVDDVARILECTEEEILECIKRNNGRLEKNSRFIYFKKDKDAINFGKDFEKTFEANLVTKKLMTGEDLSISINKEDLINIDVLVQRILFVASCSFCVWILIKTLFS